MLENPVLESRIESFCRKYGENAEDIAQTVRLALLEKSRTDPTFAKQQIGYQIKYAKWKAQNAFDATRTYNHYVESEPQVIGDDGDIGPYFEEFVSDPTQNVEAQVVERETQREISAALAKLQTKQALIVRLLMQGYQPGEISVELGLSRSSVSHITARMQTAMKLELSL